MSTLDVEKLLSELAHGRRDRGGISTTSLNVIVFVENDDALLHWMAESSDVFAEAHGFRILLLDGSRGSQNHSVRTRCKELGETLVTSLEQIQIGVKDVGAAELRSISHDLLVPNVRNVLLWAGNHLADDRFGALSELAQRIVLFTSAGPSAIDFLRELAQMESTPLASRICDLAYMRLFAWQDFIAQFFDEPDLAAELPTITRVDITTGSDPEAYYLAAWLAARLGWEPCGDMVFAGPQGCTISATLHKKGLPRRVRSVELQAASCTFGAALSDDAEDLICLTVSGKKNRPQRCVPLHDVDIVSLVERSIFSPEDGGVYLQTLGVLHRLLGWKS